NINLKHQPHFTFLYNKTTIISFEFHVHRNLPSHDFLNLR
ncbi:unnamed protein product, partial [Rotaria socialis]